MLTVILLLGGFGRSLLAFLLWVVAIWCTFIVIFVLNGIISRVFGFTLEPVGPDGVGGIQ